MLYKSNEKCNSNFYVTSISMQIIRVPVLRQITYIVDITPLYEKIFNLNFKIKYNS